MSEEQRDQSPLEAFLNSRKLLVERAKHAINKVITDQKFDRKDVVQTLVAVSDVLDSNDQLLQFVIQDLQVVAMRFQQLEVSAFSVQQATACVTQCLMDKGTLSKEDMEKTYNEKLKPVLEQKMADMQKQADEVSVQEETPPQV